MRFFVWWPFQRRKALPEASPGLGERVAQLECDLRALKRDVDDLDDSLRSFKGREFKRAAREAAKDDSADHAPPVPVAPNGAVPLSPSALRHAGRWPFDRR